MKIKNRQQFRQVIFNGAWRGLKWQGFEQCKINGNCALRGSNGSCCAIGWLIPNAKLDSGVTGGVSTVVDRALLADPLMAYMKNPYGSAFFDLFELMQTHDHPFNGDPVKMREDFIKLAKRWKVKIPRT